MMAVSSAAFTSEQSISSGTNNNNIFTTKCCPPSVAATTTTSAAFTNQITSSVSSSDLFKKHGADDGNLGIGSKSLVKNVSTWNPFEDEEDAHFSQLTEDHIFGAEFDKIRQEGSQNSK
jgi:hypothetical protein